MRRKLLIISLFASLATYAQDKALLEYEHVFDKAKDVDKNVVLVFGHQYCGWCKVFDRYHSDPEVKSILETEYIIHKIDILDSKAGERLYNHYELPGTPAWMIYDSEMSLLSNGKKSDGRIIGYPYSESEIDLYQEAIRKTSSRIDEAELELLGKKLQGFGNSRNKESEKGS